MKSKKLGSFLVIFAVIFLILYLVLAAKPLTKENQYIPEWKIKISEPQAESDAEIFSFKLGKEIGYFSADGKIIHRQKIDQKSSISDFYYAPYTTSSASITLYTSEGNEQCKIEKAGFPYLSEDRIYMMAPGGTSFSVHNQTGLELWSIESVMTLTAFSSGKKYTAAGYLDGKIKVFNNEDGTEIKSFEPGGSDFPIILGLDVSEDGRYAATVCGQDRQRFVVAKIDEIQPKVIYHEYISEQAPKRCLVKICPENGCVYYNTKNRIGIYNIAENTQTFLPTSDRILDLQTDGTLVFLLGKSDDGFTIYIIEKNNVLAGTFQFKADSSFIRASKGKLYVGRDDSISCIKLAKE